MYLDEFFDYKNQLMEDILTDDDIVNTIVGDGEPVSNPASLAYSQVFPCEYVPTTADHSKTFICFDIDIQRVSSKTYYEPVIYIWIFTHRSKLRHPTGGVTSDKLCQMLAEKLDGSRKYGLGELNLYSVKRFAPVTDFQGKVMTFVATDFNRQYPTNKTIPGNRKGG